MTVHGIDLDEDALQVARARCDAYGLRATFHAVNAVDFLRSAGRAQYGMVIFFACLEHMTHEERLHEAHERAGYWE